MTVLNLQGNPPAYQTLQICRSHLHPTRRRSQDLAQAAPPPVSESCASWVPSSAATCSGLSENNARMLHHLSCLSGHTCPFCFLDVIDLRFLPSVFIAARHNRDQRCNDSSFTFQIHCTCLKSRKVPLSHTPSLRQRRQNAGWTGCPHSSSTSQGIRQVIVAEG